MRIAVIAPPWYSVPPSGYGGIEWVVALLADGLTERGHEVTLFAPPGSETEAQLVPPLREVPPEELIGDPWCGQCAVRLGWWAEYRRRAAVPSGRRHGGGD